jgi:cell division septation protein DedD
MSNPGTASKLDTVVKLALISFVVVLSFAVGTYVGKKVSDADYRQAALENEYGTAEAKRDVASVGKDAAEKSLPDPQAISDSEVAALREEFEKTEARTPSASNPTQDAASKDTHGADHVEDGYKKVGSTAAPASAAASATTIAAKTSTGATTDAKASAKTDAKVTEAADRVAKSLAPAKDEKPKAKVNTELPSVATSAIGKYTVQVASYATENEAKDQVTKLKDKGFGAFYVPADIKGQKWFRVSIGLFADQASAMDYRKQVLSSQAVTTAIVQKIVQ